MLEESVTSLPSIWASMNSWFTPTVLFVFLNLMIGTIAITSTLATSTSTPKSQPQSHDQNQQTPEKDQKQGGYIHPQLVRSPSVLQRLKSINFYNYRSPEPTTFTFEEKPPLGSDSYLQNYPSEEPPLQPPLSRSPSSLHRLRSNFFAYLSPDPTANNVENQRGDEKIQERQSLEVQQVLEKQSFEVQQVVEMQSFEVQQVVEMESFEVQQVVEMQSVEVEDEQVEERRSLDDEVEERQSLDDEFEEGESLDEIYSKLQSQKVIRSVSDTNQSAGLVPTKLPRKMKKSASVKSPFAHFEEDEIVEKRRPATVRERKVAKVTEEDDAEVDAKADDFINRFKQQLKLQRMDSMMRYKEMVHRGNEK